MSYFSRTMPFLLCSTLLFGCSAIDLKDQRASNDSGHKKETIKENSKTRTVALAENETYLAVINASSTGGMNLNIAGALRGIATIDANAQGGGTANAGLAVIDAAASNSTTGNAAFAYNGGTADMSAKASNYGNATTGLAVIKSK